MEELDMNKNRTLLVMAAGMGSRFGGLKQIEPFGPNGEFLIDYSIYDAKRNGFTKVVFIIKKEHEKIFRETIGSRVEDQIQVEYVFQSLDNVPEGYEVPEKRVKPWGTAHAILCAKEKIKEPFCVINADDFYGKEAFEEASSFFETNSDENIYGLVLYQVSKTLSKNGSAKRGVCEIENGYLKEIIESKVEKTENGILAEPLNGSPSFHVSEDQLVSMNMLLFYPNLFPYLEEKWHAFLSLPKEKLIEEEFLIPDVVQMAKEENLHPVKVMPTSALWHGVTYREDKEEVVSEIAKKVEAGIYPSPLWGKK